MVVLVTGATGLIGKRVCKRLIALNHQVIAVTRTPRDSHQPGLSYLVGDLNSAPLQSEDLNKIEAVVHLAGESIAGRWTRTKKESVLNSRVQGTKNLLDSFPENNQLKVWIGASAIGFYGHREDEELTESCLPGTGFLSEVTTAWEQAQKAVQARIPLRQALFRIGIVLAKDGGALPLMARPIAMGVGSCLGDGRQWMSWIHIDDLVELVCESLTQPTYEGVFNAVAPEPLRHREFMKLLAQTLNRWLLPSVPASMIKIGLGEMSSLVLDSQKVKSRVPYSFRYPKLEMALKHLYQK